MKLSSAGIPALVLALAGSVSIFSPALADNETKDDSAALISIIQAIEEGWEQASGEPFREHYLDFEGTRYIESGGQNEGLDDLITHHVEPEGDAFDGFDLSLTNIETHVEGDFAWALADVELRAAQKDSGEKIHIRGYETFIFRRIDSEWKVIHTHSSSRPAD